MAFNNNPGKQSFTATGGQTAFDFNFKIYADIDLKVYLTPEGQDPNDANDILSMTTNYTVVIDGDDGGTITLTSGATLNDTIVIARDLDVTRNVSYVTNGDLKAATLNLDQDYQTYLIIDGVITLANAVQLPQSAVGVNPVLPNVRADSYLKWNSAGDALENDETIPQAVVDAAASATAASTSATNAAASKAAAEAVYDDFDDRYLGAKTSDPTLDNDGDPLITGALYFNTTSSLMKVYNGSTWDIIETIAKATAAEIRTGTDDEKYVTPLGINATIIGMGQSYQDVTGSRSVGVTYTNSTGRPIVVCIFTSSGSGNSGLYMSVDGIQIQTSVSFDTNSKRVCVTTIVPEGSTYELTTLFGSIAGWIELR